MLHKSNSYIIVHANCISGDTKIPDASIVVENGIIARIIPEDRGITNNSLPVFDAGGKTAGPGLVDMHIHGAGGGDMAGSNLAQNLTSLSSFLEDRGITSFQPTIVMNQKTLTDIRDALETHPSLADKIPGVYIEGPFIALDKKGGIPTASVSEYSEELLDAILAVHFRGRPLVKTMTLAPEKKGSDQIQAQLVHSGIVPSWGHSNAYLEDVQYKTAVHLTHLFNCMNGIDHKKPGLTLLPFLAKNHTMTFEVIADGVHVHPSILDFLFNSSVRENICLVSDAMSSCGMEKGESVYLGKQVMCDGRCSRYKESNTLIGSAMLISQTAQELFSKRLIDEIGFFRIASRNPAMVTGMTDRGILEVGKRADIVLCNADMNICDVFTPSLRRPL